jgi:hypothetical protein
VLSWREPKKVKGPFTATLEMPGPFKYKSESVTIGAEESNTPEKE